MCARTATCLQALTKYSTYCGKQPIVFSDNLCCFVQKHFIWPLPCNLVGKGCIKGEFRKWQQLFCPPPQTSPLPPVRRQATLTVSLHKLLLNVLLICIKLLPLVGPNPQCLKFEHICVKNGMLSVNANDNRLKRWDLL